MPLNLITAPASEPITLAEAKAHLRLEESGDDTYVTSLIAAARHWVEQTARRGLVTQTWELTEKAFPLDALCPPEKQGFELPFGNLVSVTSLTYVDADGVSQVMSSGDYSVDTATVPGRLRLAYGKSWPSARLQWDAVKIRYVVGWAQNAVPEPIKQAIKLLVSQMYEQRTPEVTGATLGKVQFAVDALLAPYRLVRF